MINFLHIILAILSYKAVEIRIAGIHRAYKTNDKFNLKLEIVLLVFAITLSCGLAFLIYKIPLLNS